MKLLIENFKRYLGEEIDIDIGAEEKKQTKWIDQPFEGQEYVSRLTRLINAGQVYQAIELVESLGNLDLLDHTLIVFSKALQQKWGNSEWWDDVINPMVEDKEKFKKIYDIVSSRYDHWKGIVEGDDPYGKYEHPDFDVYMWLDDIKESLDLEIKIRR